MDAKYNIYKNYNNYKIYMYSSTVIEHFSRPHNMGRMDNPDGMGKVGNPNCGDEMTLYIKVNRENNEEIIEDIKFETLGCAAAIATSSMITDLAKGKTLDEALEITYDDVAHALGELPPIKVHCADLAVRALRKAVENYKGFVREQSER